MLLLRRQVQRQQEQLRSMQQQLDQAVKAEQTRWTSTFEALVAEVRERWQHCQQVSKGGSKPWWLLGRRGAGACNGVRHCPRTTQRFMCAYTTCSTSRCAQGGALAAWMLFCSSWHTASAHHITSS